MESKICKYCNELKHICYFKYRRGKPLKCLDCERAYRREYQRKLRKKPGYRTEENKKQNNNKARKSRREYMRRRRANMTPKERAFEIARTAKYNKAKRELRKKTVPGKLKLMDSCLGILRDIKKKHKTVTARDFVTKKRIEIFEKKMALTGWTWADHGNKPGMFNIDHVCPKMFLIENGVDDIDTINHPDNLQPLEFSTNLSKQNKMTTDGVKFVRKHVPHLFELALAELKKFSY